MTDNIPYWRTYIAQAEQLCKNAGGWLSWKTKYENIDFTPVNVNNGDVISEVWKLEDMANNIDPQTGNPHTVPITDMETFLNTPLYKPYIPLQWIGVDEFTKDACGNIDDKRPD
jgi:hypothetical protein